MARPIQPFCKYGHPRTEENAYYHMGSKGYILRQCKPCRDARSGRQEVSTNVYDMASEPRSLELLNMARSGRMRDPQDTRVPDAVSAPRHRENWKQYHNRRNKWRQLKREEGRGAKGRFAPSYESCPKGHPRTEASTFFRPNGWVGCKECRKINKRKYESKMKKSSEWRAMRARKAQEWRDRKKEESAR